MEAPEEKRTPHSDITSFLILSNNHYTELTALSKPQMRLQPPEVRVDFPDTPFTARSSTCFSDCCLYVPEGSNRQPTTLIRSLCTGSFIKHTSLVLRGRRV